MRFLVSIAPSLFRTIWSSAGPALASVPSFIDAFFSLSPGQPWRFKLDEPFPFSRVRLKLFCPPRLPSPALASICFREGLFHVPPQPSAARRYAFLMVSGLARALRQGRSSYWVAICCTFPLEVTQLRVDKSFPSLADTLSRRPSWKLINRCSNIVKFIFRTSVQLSFVLSGLASEKVHERKGCLVCLPSAAPRPAAYYLFWHTATEYF